MEEQFEEIFSPARGLYLAKEVDDDELPVTPGGIILPQSRQRQYRSAVIVKAPELGFIENGVEQPIDFTAGQEVMLFPVGGIDLGDGYLLIRNNEILGILT